VKTREDVFWYFSLNVLVLFLNNLVNLFYCRGKLDFSVKELEIKKHIKPLLYIFASTLAISLYAIIDILILGFLKGDVYVGYYTLASKLNKVPLTFIVSLGIILLPQLTQAAHEKDIVNFKRLIQKSIDFVIMLSVPITIGLILCSHQFIVLFSGNQFLSASRSMEIMSGISLLIGLSNIYGMQILIPFGEDKKLLISVLIGTVISLTLNFILIPIWADFGAAFTNLISELAVTVIMGYFVSKVIEIPLPFKALASQSIFYIPVLLLGFYLRDIIDSDILYVSIITVSMSMTFLIINLVLLRTPLVTEIVAVFKQKIKYL